MSSNSLKLSVSGSHGTGKTTLCRALLNKLSDNYSCMICREAPHLIMDEVSDPTFFHLNQNTLSRQLLIFIFQAMEERNEQEVDILIHDRTPVDILAYTFLVNPDYEHSVEGRLLSSAVHRWLSRYDIVFRTPIEFPMPLDGTRDPDLSFQRRVQEKIDELYRTFRCDPITVRGSVEERVKQVENTLANFGPRSTNISCGSNFFV